MTAYDRLSAALRRVPASVEEMREALRYLNDAPDLSAAFDAIIELSRIHGREPDAGLASEFTTLRSALAGVGLDPEQQEMGQERWKALRAARGNLYSDIDDVLRSASDLGIRASEPSMALPHAEAVNRHGREGQLLALAERLKAVEEILRERVAPEGVPAPGRPRLQVVLVQQYLAVMRRSTRLFHVTLGIGEMIDLAALERLIGMMGTATRDFQATVTSAVSRATATLRESASLIRGPIQRLARGVSGVVRYTIRAEAHSNPPAQAPEFDLDEACEMILRGEAPPPSWRPQIESLNLSGTQLADLTPLAGLTSLEMLKLQNTPVRDLTPLAGLTSLRHLVLMESGVTDLTPLAGLTELQHLDLMLTKIADLAPLAGLVKLELLDLIRTQVSDLTPLANLSELDTIKLLGTNVTDVTPLAGLHKLRSLDLRLTDVEDVSALAGLKTLEMLWVESDERLEKFQKIVKRKGVVRRA